MWNTFLNKALACWADYNLGVRCKSQERLKLTCLIWVILNFSDHINKNQLKIQKWNLFKKFSLLSLYTDSCSESWSSLVEPRDRAFPHLVCASPSAGGALRPSSRTRGWSSTAPSPGWGRTSGSLRRRCALVCRWRPRSEGLWSSPDGEGSRTDGIYWRTRTKRALKVSLTLKQGCFVVGFCFFFTVPNTSGGKSPVNLTGRDLRKYPSFKYQLECARLCLWDRFI